MRLRTLKKRNIAFGTLSTTFALVIAAAIYHFYADQDYADSDKPDKCAYRSNQDIINDRSNLTYSSLADSPFKYKETLQNDYNFYTDTEQSPPAEGNFLLSDNVLVQYLSKEHEEISRHAVVLVHGNSSMPDGFFSDTGSYLNVAGQYIYDEGFDVFAPYATHNSRFQISRRRLASMFGHYSRELDVKRTIKLLEYTLPRYDYVHLAGVSNGGFIVALVWDTIESKHPDLSRQIGVVLSIEGYNSIEKWLEKYSDISLFHWKWEVGFPGVKSNDFKHLSGMPNVFLAIGSCGEEKYGVRYEDIRHDEHTVIRYDGAHEFKPDVFMTAFDRWKSEAAMQ